MQVKDNKVFKIVQNGKKMDLSDAQLKKNGCHSKNKTWSEQ